MHGCQYVYGNRCIGFFCYKKRNASAFLFSVLIFTFANHRHYSQSIYRITGNDPLEYQQISLYTNLAVGRPGELPELLKRILDVNDVLQGTLEYKNCGLSDDGGKLIIPSGLATASVNVKSGVLGGTTIFFV